MLAQPQSQQTVIFLMGPTASGKTALAEQLYESFNCELISVDSAQVYQGLNIGSAKPSSEELLKTPHQLIDICTPDKPYSASQFCLDARLNINEILARGKVPVLVGGTMLYFKALRDGLADLPQADKIIRAKINKEAEEKGWSSLHEQLASYDPDSAQRIKIADTQRLQRAVEVYRISGKSLTQHFKEQSINPLEQQILSIAIAPESREVLRERIAIRFDQMLGNGLIKEVEGILNKGYSIDLPALKSVGYRQVIQFLTGELDYQQMREKAVTASRQLAKRQMTWLRKWPELNWLESGDPSNFERTKDLLMS